jgi:hypothetical protein
MSRLLLNSARERRCPGDEASGSHILLESIFGDLLDLMSR